MIHVIICFVLIGLILVQQGKGAEIGASFGSGASQTLFGSQGSSSFLWKLTGGIGIAFFAVSLLLGYMASYEIKQTNQVILPASAPSKTQAPVPTTQHPSSPASHSSPTNVPDNSPNSQSNSPMKNQQSEKLPGTNK